MVTSGSSHASRGGSPALLAGLAPSILSAVSGRL